MTEEKRIEMIKDAINNCYGEHGEAECDGCPSKTECIALWHALVIKGVKVHNCFRNVGSHIDTGEPHCTVCGNNLTTCVDEPGIDDTKEK